MINKAVTLIIFIMLLAIIPKFAIAQFSVNQLHGHQNYLYSGLHSGNQIRTTFFNTSYLGDVSPDDFPAEWPINSGQIYLGRLVMFVGSEVKDTDGQIIHITSEGTSGDPNWSESDDQGILQSFLPLPGFCNDEEQKVAMSQWEESWPEYWPDKMDDATDPGWAGLWNGYFGKNVQNADQESYYVADDYQNDEWSYYPDSTDLDRRGLGVRATCRGFQWSSVLVEDILFLLYDIKNVGTRNHEKFNFGIMSGPNIGRREGGGRDSADDGGSFDLQEDLGWHWDADNIGDGGFTPVGLLGFAFFESPGNPFDGIDNDGDALDGPGPVITEDFFKPKLINSGDQIVLIDYQTFERTVTEMPANGVTIIYNKNPYHFAANVEYEEIPNNLIDDNLNGIIDENNGSVLIEDTEEIRSYLYLGMKYVDYFTGEGKNNELLDEKRDDGIDNDGDWDVNVDDVGLDGVARTGDFGENDGQPTSGRGTDLPGEPHIDKTDIDESDMIGLTAFNLYVWPENQLDEDEALWEGIRPGFLDRTAFFGDTDALMGSGYFPLKSQQIERFSMAMVMGVDEGDLLRNKNWAATTYHENYNFSKAPVLPTLTAIPGDKKVTLLWDDLAEKSFDPITGYDFEGYRVYRSTDPGFTDMKAITDAYGSISYREPIAQFDLDNDIEGLAAIHINGVHFYLGNNTGLSHSFVDTTVNNGQLYYYAVSSYDQGSDSLGIAPTECAKYIAVSKDGVVDKGKNVAVVRPEAPAAGYIPADFDLSQIKRLPGTVTSGIITYEIVNPADIKADNTYRITFNDTTLQNLNYPATKNFNFVNVTTGDTLLKESTLFQDGEKLPLMDGFILSFYNNPEMLGLNENNSGWSRTGIYPFRVSPFNLLKQPVELMAADFKIIFGEVGVDTSTTYYRGSTELPAIPVNFTILNTSLHEKVKFAFREQDAVSGEEGKFTYRTDRIRGDEIILMTSDSLHASWQISFTNSGTDTLQPGTGDTLKLIFDKPFLSHDVFEFTTKSEKLDNGLAKENLDQIRVVPNPYIVSNSWEPQNPYSSGRGPRELHFIHLPTKCTIRIFNIRGQLIRELEHDKPDITDGTEIWDMLSKDLLEISYGIYVYHINALGLGEKIGKFAIIK